MRTACLVHGLGSQPGWWGPVLPVLQSLDIQSCALELPCLEKAGPEAWVAEVSNHLRSPDVCLIGHSLGAAVCLEVSRQHPVGLIVLLACPPFVAGYTPDPPPESGMSDAALRRVETFLRRTLTRLPVIREGERRVHLVGTNDPWVPIEQARKLPIPVVPVPGAGHNLNRSETARHLLRETLLHSASA